MDGVISHAMKDIIKILFFDSCCVTVFQWTNNSLGYMLDIETMVAERRSFIHEEKKKHKHKQIAQNNSLCHNILHRNNLSSEIIMKE